MGFLGQRHLAQFGHGALGDQLALRDDPDPVADFLRDLERVRAHEDGFALLVRELAEGFFQEARALGVHPDHGLVHDDHPRVMEERAGKHQPLFHAVGKTFHQLVGPGFEVEEFELNRGLFFHLGFGHAIDAADEMEELGGGEFFVDVGAVGDESDQGLGGDGVLGEVVSADGDFAGGGFQEADEHADGGGLAGAVGSEEPVNFAGLNVEVEFAGGREVAVFFSELFGLDHWYSMTSILVWPTTCIKLIMSARFPVLSRIWVASAGNWLKVGSTRTHWPLLPSGSER